MFSRIPTIRIQKQYRFKKLLHNGPRIKIPLMRFTWARWGWCWMNCRFHGRLIYLRRNPWRTLARGLHGHCWKCGSCSRCSRMTSRHSRGGCWRWPSDLFSVQSRVQDTVLSREEHRRICGTENGVVYESDILHDAAVAADRKSAVVCPVEDPTAANQGVVLHDCVTEKGKGLKRLATMMPG